MLDGNSYSRIKDLLIKRRHFKYILKTSQNFKR